MLVEKLLREAAWQPPTGQESTRACLRGPAGLRPDPVVMSRTQVLTDEMWARIEPLLPPLKGPMGKTMRPHRPLVEGSIFPLRAGPGRAGVAGPAGRVRSMADRLETARQVQQGRHLGQGPARVADAG